MEGYKRAIQEKRFEYKGFPCVIIMQALGFRTGYVGIKKGNKFYGVPYDDIDIDCHGGLTYSNYCLVDQDDEDMWWIGFDTGHCYDAHDFEAALELFKDYPKVVEHLNFERQIEIECGVIDIGTIRSLEYCEQQCKHIVDQIIELDL